MSDERMLGWMYKKDELLNYEWWKNVSMNDKKDELMDYEGWKDECIKKDELLDYKWCKNVRMNRYTRRITILWVMKGWMDV